MLLREKSETVIPVSCTEQGRWSFVSPTFADSGVVLNAASRSRKAASVSESLGRGRRFESDQGEVWASVERLHEASGTAPPTGAMRAAYEQRAEDLTERLAAMPCLPGQRGILAFADGSPVGSDFVSL